MYLSWKVQILWRYSDDIRVPEDPEPEGVKHPDDQDYIILATENFIILLIINILLYTLITMDISVFHYVQEVNARTLLFMLCIKKTRCASNK